MVVTVPYNHTESSPTINRVDTGRKLNVHKTSDVRSICFLCPLGTNWLEHLINLQMIQIKLFFNDFSCSNVYLWSCIFVVTGGCGLVWPEVWSHKCTAVITTLMLWRFDLVIMTCVGASFGSMNSFWITIPFALCILAAQNKVSTKQSMLSYTSEIGIWGCTSSEIMTVGLQRQCLTPKLCCEKDFGRTCLYIKLVPHFPLTI